MVGGGVGLSLLLWERYEGFNWDVAEGDGQPYGICMAWQPKGSRHLQSATVQPLRPCRARLHQTKSPAAPFFAPC